MFKPGDKVYHIDNPDRWMTVDAVNRMGLISFVEYPNSGFFCNGQYRVKTEPKMIENMNPAIEEYAKIVTVRKIRAHSVIQFSGGNKLQVQARGYGINLRTTNNISESCNVTTNELRALVKQLTEIADVLEEGGKS